jgi:hypothetical protein
MDEIGSMLSAGGQPMIDRSLLAAKADEIDSTIKRLLRAAAAGALEQRHKKRRI